MPAHRSISAFPFAVDSAPAPSAVPAGAARWGLPLSLALHAVIVVLVASFHAAPAIPPTVVSVELAFIEAPAEPTLSSEPAEEMAGEAPPEPVPDVAVEQGTEPAPQPPVDSSDIAAEPPFEAPASPTMEPPVPAPPKPEPARPVPVLHPPPKPLRARPLPAAISRPSPRPSVAEPAAERITQPAPAQPAPAQPPQAAASTATLPPGSDRQAADYFGVVQARLARYKIYPQSARLMRQEGTVTVRFTIVADGTIASWTIVQGSGHASLDQGAEDMIRRASPLPPIPAELGRDHIDITLPVRYALR